MSGSVANFWPVWFQRRETRDKIARVTGLPPTEVKLDRISLALEAIRTGSTTRRVQDVRFNVEI
jgi:hypothetical protein